MPHLMFYGAVAEVTGFQGDFRTYAPTIALFSNQANRQTIPLTVVLVYRHRTIEVRCD